MGMFFSKIKNEPVTDLDDLDYIVETLDEPLIKRIRRRIKKDDS